MESGNLAPKLAVLEAGRFILTGTYRGKRVTFVDSLNWLPCPLDDIAAWLGRAKLPLPADNAPWVDWLERCREDALILRDAVMRLLRWHREHDLGVLRLTAAGQALQAWRHRLGPRVPQSSLSPRQQAAVKKDNCHYVYPVVHNSEHALNIERASYYGPTTAVYRLGRVEGPVYALDIQSCYPSLMRDKPYPVRLISRLEHPSPRRLRTLLESHGAIACVHLHDCSYEYPIRTERWTGRATGTAWTVLPAPELRRCLELGVIDRVEVCYLYEERAIFADYVDELAALRASAALRGDKMLECVSKNMANAIYGKLGQRAGDWELTGQTDPVWLWGERWRLLEGGTEPQRLRSLGGYIQARTLERESATSFPAIPAYVTSYARLEMDRLQQLAGFGHYYHSYSDSLHVDSDGYRALVDAGAVCLNEPGRLRVQSLYDWVHYYAAGRYEASDGRHLAGLSRTHWIGADGTLRHWHYTSASESLTAGLRSGRPLPGVLVREETYGLSESSGHRLVGPGNWTYPHVLTAKDAINGETKEATTANRRATGATVDRASGMAL